tara:strand:- start:17 stop:139 length:123 start_codon:yes stop_codon:yes gene_type:complete
MKNSGLNSKEAVEILHKDNAQKINLDWKINFRILKFKIFN